MNLKIIALLLSGGTTATSLAGPDIPSVPVTSVQCVHDEVHHYSFLEPTSATPGHREFYVCCGCHQSWLELPDGVTAIDTDDSLMTGGLGEDHLAYLPAGFPRTASIPTASIQEIDGVSVQYGDFNFPLEPAFGFGSNQSAYDIKDSEYAFWHADYEVTFDKDLNTNGGDPASLAAHGGVMLVGHYDAFCALQGQDWLQCELEDVKAGQSIRLLSDVLETNINYLEIGLLGYSDYEAFYDFVEDNSLFPLKDSMIAKHGEQIKAKLEEIEAGTYQGYSNKGFTCGAVAIAGDSMPADGFTMTVSLKLYETEAYETAGTYNKETGRSLTINTVTKHFSPTDYQTVE